MSPSSPGQPVKSVSFPRVSGDEPETFRNAVNAAWFSLHERG